METKEQILGAAILRAFATSAELKVCEDSQGGWVAILKPDNTVIEEIDYREEWIPEPMYPYDD
jgi:hypothetical protein